MLVFGAGTDYALLLISRYRDQLRVEDGPPRGDGRSRSRRTAEAVLSSATTVVLGLLTLLLSLFPANPARSGWPVPSASWWPMVFALVVLPAALVVFGRWIFWPNVPHVGETGLADGRVLAPGRRGGRRAPRRLRHRRDRRCCSCSPRRHHPDPDRPRPGRPVPQKPEAIAGQERLAQAFPAGAADPPT